MAPECYIQDSEKVEEAPISIQGSASEDPAKPESEHENEISIQEAQDVTQDLESLTPVASGPAYSVFSKRKKIYILLMVTWASFISPTSATIYFPALNPLQAELHVSSTLMNLTITSYMIFQGLAPMIIGDLADMAGRRPAYILGFLVSIAANIGLALQDSYAALFLLRCLQSTGSSGAIALGYGSVADISTSSERGIYMGTVISGVTTAPALAPVIGGILAKFLGWPSIFWFLTIFTGCFLIPFILTVPETARNIVGNGSIKPQGWNLTLIEWYRLRKQEQSRNRLSRSDTAENRRTAQAELAKSRTLRWPNPLKTIRIVMEKDMAVLLFYNSLLYIAFYDVLTTLPSLFQEIYHFNELQVGFCYLPFGFGSAITSFTTGRLLDRNYKKIARQIGFTVDLKRGDDLRHFPIERARLELVWPLLSCGLVCYVCYGWALEKNAKLPAPLVLQFLIGLLVNGSFNIISVLVVDLYPQSPSTATASNNLVRCFMGAGGTAIIQIMVKRMGRGWCYTFIALVCAAASPMLWVSMKWGPKWREERLTRMDRLAADKRAQEAQESNMNSTDILRTETGTVLRAVA
jgi:MFS family permease